MVVLKSLGAMREVGNGWMAELFMSVCPAPLAFVHPCSLALHCEGWPSRKSGSSMYSDASCERSKATKGSKAIFQETLLM